MIKHVWSVLCEKSIIDNESNNISIINVLEELTVMKPPAGKKGKAGGKSIGIIPVKYEVVTLWIRDDNGEPALGRSRTRMTDSIGQVALSNEVDVDLRSYERMRTRHMFSGLPVRVDGPYVFSVEMKEENNEDWVNVARLPLKVNIKEKISK